ncbi:uncharacterized protein ASPGLDRAFT_38021 [Aspergillus glaucus CBS 516.65]|uniref:Uncharacterized protein n=1 Tax=Aspergillus glaucus CBS 516.65 TaxID=1160497 RepID=A0A1L9VCY9_ASPGL|nr:hypothetical protein ASPGLDRAFT_38021 [Aspergillus glaucus CBS 516.65]OJJ81712.1 hypothetical protein ASPGLDRAFT_38021 [Aspergillus glaucus CBS 516.65]
MDWISSVEDVLHIQERQRLPPKPLYPEAPVSVPVYPPPTAAAAAAAAATAATPAASKTHGIHGSGCDDWCCLCWEEDLFARKEEYGDADVWIWKKSGHGVSGGWC